MLEKCKWNCCRQVVVFSRAEVCKKVSLAVKNKVLSPIRTAGMWGRRGFGSEKSFVCYLLYSLRLHLTFAWVASLDVSGDTDDSQSVDARQAKEQSEETIYLEANKERGWWALKPLEPQGVDLRSSSQLSDLQMICFKVAPSSLISSSDWEIVHVHKELTSCAVCVVTASCHFDWEVLVKDRDSAAEDLFLPFFFFFFWPACGSSRLFPVSTGMK